MIKVAVAPRADNRYDIKVEVPGALILSSDQGYENVEDAERIVYRILASLHVWSQKVGVSPDFTEPEQIVLQTTYRDGKTKTEQIR